MVSLTLDDYKKILSSVLEKNEKLGIAPSTPTLTSAEPEEKTQTPGKVERIVRADGCVCTVLPAGMMDKIKVDLNRVKPKTRYKLSGLIYAMETELLGHCCSIFDSRGSGKGKYRDSTNRVFNGVAVGGITGVVNSFNKLCEYTDPDDIDDWEFECFMSMFNQVDEAIERHASACEYADIPPGQVEGLETKYIRELENKIRTASFIARLNQRHLNYILKVATDDTALEKIRAGLIRL